MPTPAHFKAHKQSPSIAFSKSLDKVSITKINRKGESVSSCLKHLGVLKNPQGVPFIEIGNDAEDLQA